MEDPSYYQDAQFIMEEREHEILAQGGHTPSPNSWAQNRGMINNGGSPTHITPLKDPTRHAKVSTLLGSALAREEYAREIFDRFDADDSGSIDVVELDLMLISLGIDRSAIFGGRSTNELVRYYDLDRDGALDFEEFVHLFNALNMYTPRSEMLGDGLMRTSSAVDAETGQLSPGRGTRRHSHVVKRVESDVGSLFDLGADDDGGVVTVLRAQAAGDAEAGKKAVALGLVPDQATFARDYARAYSSFSTDVMDFSHNFLGSKKAGKEFARLIKQNTLLRTVILRQTGIKLGGLRVIAASLEKHPSVTAVDLTGNRGLDTECAGVLAAMLKRNRGIVHLKWDTSGCRAAPECVDAVEKVLAQNRRTMTIHKQGRDLVRTAAGTYIQIHFRPLFFCFAIARLLGSRSLSCNDTGIRVGTYRGVPAFEMLEREERWREEQSAAAQQKHRDARLAAGRASMHEAIHGIDWAGTGTAPHMVGGRRSVMNTLMATQKAANRWRTRARKRKVERARVRAEAESHALGAALDLDGAGEKFLSPRRAAGDTGADAAAQDYRRQGNLDLYTDDALRQRELLKGHPLIKGCIDRWWKMLVVPKYDLNSTGFLDRDEYIAFHRGLTAALCDEPPDEEEIVVGGNLTPQRPSGSPRSVPTPRSGQHLQGGADEPEYAGGLHGLPREALERTRNNQSAYHDTHVVVSEEERLTMAEDDWKRDSGGTGRVDRARFEVSLFELADLWTETIDAQAYVDFFDFLFVRIWEQHVGEWVEGANNIVSVETRRRSLIALQSLESPAAKKAGKKAEDMPMSLTGATERDVHANVLSGPQMGRKADGRTHAMRLEALQMGLQREMSCATMDAYIRAFNQQAAACAEADAANAVLASRRASTRGDEPSLSREAFFQTLRSLGFDNKYLLGRLFDEFDKDGDDAVCWREFLSCMVVFSASAEDASQARGAAAAQDADGSEFALGRTSPATDGAGGAGGGGGGGSPRAGGGATPLANQHEVYKASIEHGSLKKVVDLLFKVYDADDSGFIKRHEFDTLFRATARIARGDREGRQAFEARAAREFNKADKNQDGKLSREEFSQLFVVNPNLMHRILAGEHAKFADTRSASEKRIAAARVKHVDDWHG